MGITKKKIKGQISLPIYSPSRGYQSSKEVRIVLFVRIILTLKSFLILLYIVGNEFRNRWKELL